MTEEHKNALDNSVKAIYESIYNLISFYDNVLYTDEEDFIDTVQKYCEANNIKIWDNDDEEQFLKFYYNRLQNRSFTIAEYKEFCNYYNKEVYEENFAASINIVRKYIKTRSIDSWRTAYRSFKPEIFMSDALISEMERNRRKRAEKKIKGPSIIKELKAAAGNYASVEVDNLIINTTLF